MQVRASMTVTYNLGPLLLNLLHLHFTNVRNKLEYLVFPAKFNVYGERPGAYPRVEHLKGASLGRFLSYSQTLDLAGKACQGKHWLIVKIN